MNKSASSEREGMSWAVGSHGLKEERRSAEKAAPAGLWSTKTIWCIGGRVKRGSQMAFGTLREGSRGCKQLAFPGHSGRRDDQR